MVKFSIIIATRKIDQQVEECISNILKQTYKDFEIILLPDKDEKRDFSKTKIFHTGKIMPAQKRDLGFKKSKGEILAFIDSDAYPRKDWLENGLKYFEDNSIGAVGGPNLTPKGVNLAEKVSGDILSSWLVGDASLRHKIGKKVKEVRELPSCNLFVTRTAFKNSGGFNVGLLTAEDTHLCFNIRKEGKSIIYAPDVIVYHHRRDSFYQFFRQMWIYGRDAGFLMKSNFTLYYTFLTAFVLAVVAGAILSLFIPDFAIFYGICWAIYLAVGLFTSLMINVKRFPLIFLGTIIVHFSYGLAFGYGWIFFKPCVNLNIR
jgi:cellulose synthase/poly-beta-1,6-N-acetylglucosamine synthase-like glycosyltransferase